MGQLFTGNTASSSGSGGFAYATTERTAVASFNISSSATVASSGTIMTTSQPIYVTGMEFAPSEMSGAALTVTLLAGSTVYAWMRYYGIYVSSTPTTRQWGHRRDFSIPILLPASQTISMQVASFNGNSFNIGASIIATINYLNATDIVRS